MRAVFRLLAFGLPVLAVMVVAPSVVQVVGGVPAVAMFVALVVVMAFGYRLPLALANWAEGAVVRDRGRL